MKAVYPGTFDPVHVGHLDIARRAARLFGELVVAVYEDSLKPLMFTMDERADMFRKALGDPSITVRTYRGLTVHFAQEIGARVIVRGLRIGADFEYEREMALMNRTLGPDIEVACLLSALEHQYVSSSRVKEIAELGGDISGFVPPVAAEALRQRIEATGKGSMKQRRQRGAGR